MPLKFLLFTEQKNYIVIFHFLMLVSIKGLGLFCESSLGSSEKTGNGEGGFSGI